MRLKFRGASQGLGGAQKTGRGNRWKRTGRNDDVKSVAETTKSSIATKRRSERGD